MTIWIAEPGPDLEVWGALLKFIRQRKDPSVKMYVGNPDENAFVETVDIIISMGQGENTMKAGWRWPLAHRVNVQLTDVEREKTADEQAELIYGIMAL